MLSSLLYALPFYISNTPQYAPVMTPTCHSLRFISSLAHEPQEQITTPRALLFPSCQPSSSCSSLVPPNYDCIDKGECLCNQTPVRGIRNLWPWLKYSLSLEQEHGCTRDKRECPKAWMKGSSTQEWLPVYLQEGGWCWLRRLCLFVTCYDLEGEREGWCLLYDLHFSVQCQTWTDGTVTAAQGPE